jgi:hypothetical protein
MRWLEGDMQGVEMSNSLDTFFRKPKTSAITLLIASATPFPKAPIARTITGRGGPQGSETSRLTHFLLIIGSQMAERLSVLRAGRPLPPGRLLVLISVRG